MSVFFVAMMTGVAIIGFIFPSKHKKMVMAWDTMAIFLLYVVDIVLLYHLS